MFSYSLATNSVHMELSKCTAHLDMGQKVKVPGRHVKMKCFLMTKDYRKYGTHNATKFGVTLRSWFL